MFDKIAFPNGIRLLASWQKGEDGARQRLKEVFDATIAGEIDQNFAVKAPLDSVNVGGAINLMTLNIMNDLYGIESAEFYKGDVERYVRTTMLSRRLLGMNKLYVSWPVYAFTAEALGQATMYPDKYPPGSDPDNMLLNRDNWRDLATPDLDSGIPKLLEETISFYTRLTGMEPILHLSAPYSLAADTFGQESLLAALVHEPDLAIDLLNHLVDHVHRPWIERFFERFPGGWVELSDASGSPFFIGPYNCANIAIRAIQRLKEGQPWGHRVYDANYRGDYVTQAERKKRGSKRRGAAAAETKEAPAITLDELTDHKHSVCQDFVIRLHDDRVPISYYENQALSRNVPLFAGIGSSQIDRNGIADLAETRRNLKTVASEHVASVKSVAQKLKSTGYDNRLQPWPGTIYFEDVSSESSFELIETVVESALQEGAL